MTGPFTVLVPASTSNLGSGFDTLSAALSLYLRVAVSHLDGPGVEWSPAWPPDEENVLDRALRSTFAHFGRKVTGLRIQMENPIPLKRGLGSSGAAIIAGIKLAQQVCRRELSEEEVFQLALPLEGHPDNLAASLRGGWVLSRIEQGRVRTERLQAGLTCRFVLAIPEVAISTQQARTILPPGYPLQDAVYNLQRCALLVHALHLGRRDLIGEALTDRLHQPYRSRLVPGMSEVLERCDLPSRWEDHLLGVCISGSGSSIAALADGDYDEIGQWMVQTLKAHRTRAQYRILDLDTRGARIEPSDRDPSVQRS